jgi:hypothetical protein
MRTSWRFAAPLLAWLVLSSFPHPAGRDAPAWHDFALLIGVVVALILEPLLASALGLFGATLAIAPGDVSPSESIKWGLVGFSDSAV